MCLYVGCSCIHCHFQHWANQRLSMWTLPLFSFSLYSCWKESKKKTMKHCRISWRVCTSNHDENANAILQMTMKKKTTRKWKKEGKNYSLEDWAFISIMMIFEMDLKHFCITFQIIRIRFLGSGNERMNQLSERHIWKCAIHVVCMYVWAHTEESTGTRESKRKKEERWNGWNKKLCKIYINEKKKIKMEK